MTRIKVALLVGFYFVLGGYAGYVWYSTPTASKPPQVSGAISAVTLTQGSDTVTPVSVEPTPTPTPVPVATAVPPRTSTVKPVVIPATTSTVNLATAGEQNWQFESPSWSSPHVVCRDTRAIRIVNAEGLPWAQTSCGYFPIHN